MDALVRPVVDPGFAAALAFPCGRRRARDRAGSCRGSTPGALLLGRTRSFGVGGPTSRRRRDARRRRPLLPRHRARARIGVVRTRPRPSRYRATIVARWARRDREADVRGRIGASGRARSRAPITWVMIRGTRRETTSRCFWAVWLFLCLPSRRSGPRSAGSSILPRGPDADVDPRLSIGVLALLVGSIRLPLLDVRRRDRRVRRRRGVGARPAAGRRATCT